MKKVINLLLVMLLMTFTLGTVAHAAEPNPGSYEAVVNKVETANIQINIEIEKAVEAGNKITAFFDSKISKLDATDYRVYVLKSAEDLALEAVITDLIEDTNRIAQEAVEFGAKNGYTVTCELIEVHIGYKTVMIDPLRVIGD